MLVSIHTEESQDNHTQGKSSEKYQIRYWVKYGINNPNSFNHNLCLDEELWSDPCRQAIEKKKVKVSLESLKGSDNTPRRLKNITEHCILDVNMRFNWKAILMS